MLKSIVLFAALIFSVLAAPQISRSRFYEVGTPFIVGGTPATPNEFPFMVSMQFQQLDGSYSHHCGASIVNENWAISAAHCTESARPRTTRIAAGVQSLSNPSGTEQYSGVDSFYVHPKYDTVTLENDMVLIKLLTPFNFTGAVKSISIPIQNQDTPAGTMATVAGWGNLASNNPNRPDILQKVSIPTVTDETCRASSLGSTDMFDSFICAGYPEGGKDSCNGDSGGPLFTSNPFQLIGIVSWGIQCALPNYYGVYTEVSYFSDWIGSTATV